MSNHRIRFLSLSVLLGAAMISPALAQSGRRVAADAASKSSNGAAKARATKPLSPAQAVLAAAEQIEQRTPISPIASHAPVLVVPQLFEPDFCERLIDYWHAAEKVSDMVATGDNRGGGQAAETQLKRRDDAPVVDVDLTRAIAERLARRVGPLVTKAFHTTANHFETFRIGCYEAADGGHFGRHWDDTAPKTAHRKLAMSVNLNTGEFEGGELIFPEFGRQRYVPPLGGAVVFSCALLHEALPVTKGRRFGLFGFFYDDEGAARMRQQIEAAGGRIKTEVG